MVFGGEFGEAVRRSERKEEMSTVLYKKGNHWVCAENGGFAVYTNDFTHILRVAKIERNGEDGFLRAIAEVDRREKPTTSLGE